MTRWVCCLYSPPCLFGGVTFGLENFDEGVAVVALYFDGVVFDGSAGAATGLELASEAFEFGGGEGQAGDDGDALALAALGLAGDADDAVGFGDQIFGVTGALVDGPVAVGAHPAVIG